MLDRGKDTANRIESDQPIRSSQEDKFGRWNFARRVADVIAKRNDPETIVIGLHAPWGEGKTSVLNMIRERLETYDHIEILKFNPWRFPDETQLLRHFFEVLASKLDASIITTGERVGEFMRRYADALTPLQLLGVDAGDAVRRLSPAAADIELVKERVINILTKSEKRLVIVMDDIDRLDKAEIQAVFRLVKLSADFPNTAYILSFDQDMVASAVAERYSGDTKAGRNFLEKIIQVSLSLPPASLQSLMTLTVEGIEAALAMAEIQLTDEERLTFADVFDKGFRTILGTPRLSKRLANVLTFALPLVKGEVDTVDFILLEAIRAFYPKIYDSIRDNSEIYRNRTVGDPYRRDDDAFSGAKKIVEDSLAGLTENQKRSATLLLLELFPRTQDYKLLSYPYSSDVRRESPKRITSNQYFTRYFTYGVQPHDVSDNDVEGFLQLIPEREPQFIVHTVSHYVEEDPQRAKSFIGKLRQHEDQLDPVRAERLALGLALSGGAFPQLAPVDRSLGLGSSPQAAILIRKLLLRIADREKRESLAIEIAQYATPLPFAYDFWHWLQPRKDSHSGEKVAVISEECQTRIKRIISERIAAKARELPLGETYGLDAQSLYHLWFASTPDDLQHYLSDAIEKNNEAAVDFLVAMLQVDPKPSPYAFTHPEGRYWYEFIIKVIDPLKILEALRRTHPDAFKTRKDHNAEQLLDQRQRAAEWFVQMYENVQSVSFTTDD